MFYQNSNDLVKHTSVKSGHLQNSKETQQILSSQVGENMKKLNENATISAKDLGPDLKSLYDIELSSATGEPNFLQQFKGKVTLFVNTTVGCGNANQMEVLEWLHKKYKDQGFSVVAFFATLGANSKPTLPCGSSVR